MSSAGLARDCVAESKFRRVKGYQEKPQLMDAMITSVSKKGVAKKGRSCLTCQFRGPLLSTEFRAISVKNAEQAPC